MQTIDLSALIGSRICHDLISPISAIGNGVELMELSGIERTPEIDLIAQSVENANARIRFFRIAFGKRGTGGKIAKSDIIGPLAALSGGGVSIFCGHRCQTATVTMFNWFFWPFCASKPRCPWAVMSRFNTMQDSLKFMPAPSG